MCHFLNMEEIGALRARSLGRIDQIYYPYYENDLKNGTYSFEEIKEMLRYHDYAENKYTVIGKTQEKIRVPEKKEIDEAKLVLNKRASKCLNRRPQL